MKFVSILLAMVLLMPESAFAEELNGYLWERMDAFGKILFMAGYVGGFRHGTVYGSDYAVNASSGYLKDIGNTRVYGVRKFREYSKCGASIDRNREEILKAAARYARNSLDKPIEYYVAEVDSFYQRYPLCKSKDLPAMLTDISLVWLRMRGYADVGRECTESSGAGSREGRLDGQTEKR